MCGVLAGRARMALALWMREPACMAHPAQRQRTRSKPRARCNRSLCDVQVSFRNRVLILFDWLKTRVFGRDTSLF
jgi:hypothetical protein